MLEFIPADQTTRDAIRTELTRNFFVEAGAGTGKTTVLVDRIAEILRSGYATVDEIAVITFTEKAAAELASRTRDRLEAARATSDDPAEQERLDHALAGLGRARIETLHAFALGLLRERPVEAGLDPTFETLDELAAELAFDEAYQRWLTAQLSEPPMALRVALQRRFSLAHLREIAKRIHDNRDLLPLAPIEAPPPDVDGFLAQLDQDTDELLDLLRECRDLSDRGAQQIETIRRFRDDCLACGDNRARLERIILQGVKIASNAGANGKWSEPQYNARQKEICAELKAALAEIQADLRADAVAGLIPLAEGFVRDYERERRASGKAEFADQLNWARDLLRDNPDVRRYFQDRFKCILLDEFQDTDPLQVEIVLYLCAKGQTSKDWRELRPDPGALFVVGDPKQSIYRFRRADITIYEWVKTAVLPSDFAVISQNFRSLSPVIDWVNRVFGELMEPIAGVQADYIPLVAREHAIDLPHAPVVLVHPAEAGTKAEERRMAEADALARALHRAVNGEPPWFVRDPETGEVRPARWQDVAVLVPARTDIEIYEDALAEAGIPYRVEKGRAFYQRQEIRDLTACLRAVDDPGDRISLVAALRSGAFGCSDEAIFHAFTAAPRGELDYRQPPAELPEPVGDALATLRDLHVERRRLALPALVQKVLDRTHLVEYALTLPQGDQAAANLLKAVDQARAFAGAQGGGLRAFVRWIDTTTDRGAAEEDAAVAESGDDVVRILTIHAAKGLEFPIVALANLSNNDPSADTTIVDREARRLHLRLGSKDLGWATPGFEEAAEHEKIHAMAEQDRRLYVAATRARDFLLVPVMPLADPSKAKGMVARLLPFVTRAETADGDDCYHLDTVTLSLPANDAVTWDESPGEADIAAALRERDAWDDARKRLLETAKQGLRTVTATSIETWDQTAPPTEAETVWSATRSEALALGTALHDTMQVIALPGGEDLETVARERAAEAGLRSPDEIIRLARRCLASPVIGRAVRAGRYQREVAFAIGLPDGGLIEGRMDLLFREPDGLVIVDYKTDRVDDGDALDRRLEHYRTQAAVYAYAAREATGLPVKEVVFIFARPGIERAIPADRDLLAEGERLARGHGVYGVEPEE